MKKLWLYCFFLVSVLFLSLLLIFLFFSCSSFLLLLFVCFLISYFKTRYTSVEFDNENKNAGILSIKISLSKTHRNHYLDSHCILMVMVPEMMIRAMCCEKHVLNKWKKIKVCFKVDGFSKIWDKLWATVRVFINYFNDFRPL